ncbi:hypothetical protein SESBI_46976 [Sesbania bispinosa]|nr:hypothetical protein SESBI_46976 [Sesbania bispinosa]
MKVKIDSLTTEFQQKTLEQEMIKKKMDQWEQKFERLILHNTLPELPPKLAGENVNDNEDFSDDEINDCDDVL